MNNPVEEYLLNISRLQFFGKMAQGIGAMALGSVLNSNMFENRENSILRDELFKLFVCN